VPEPDGKLTAEEQREVLAYLKSRATSACPSCEGTDWELEEYLGSLPIYSRTHMINGPVFPFVVVICKTCGFTRLHGALKVGLFPEFAEAKSEPAEKGAISGQG
jgi:hypothetical protein